MIEDIPRRCANLQANVFPRNVECLANRCVHDEVIRPIQVIPPRVAICAWSRLGKCCRVVPLVDGPMRRIRTSDLIGELLSVARLIEGVIGTGSEVERTAGSPDNR